MLLEQESINVASDLCQPGKAYKIALFNGYLPKLTFVRGEVLGNIRLLFGKVIDPCLVGAPDFLLDLVNLRLHILN